MKLERVVTPELPVVRLAPWAARSSSDPEPNTRPSVPRSPLTIQGSDPTVRTPLDRAEIAIRRIVEITV